MFPGIQGFLSTLFAHNSFRCFQDRFHLSQALEGKCVWRTVIGTEGCWWAGRVYRAGLGDQSPPGQQSPNWNMHAVPLVSDEMQKPSPQVLRHEILQQEGGGVLADMTALQG